MNIKKLLTSIIQNLEIRELLWTNPSPSSAFPPKTVSLDLEKYDNVDVNALQSVSSKVRTGFVRAAVGDVYDSRLEIFYNNLNVRDFRADESGVTFAAGYTSARTASMSVANNAVIPYKIYGVKRCIKKGE